MEVQSLAQWALPPAERQWGSHQDGGAIFGTVGSPTCRKTMGASSRWRCNLWHSGFSHLQKDYGYFIKMEVQSLVQWALPPAKRQRVPQREGCNICYTSGLGSKLPMLMRLATCLLNIEIWKELKHQFPEHC
eukprot:1137345-Pelagomonas_calceolata.AAC.9